jgi:hypothetical protein
MKPRIGFSLVLAFALAGAVGSFQACGGPTGGDDGGGDGSAGDGGGTDGGGTDGGGTDGGGTDGGADTGGGDTGGTDGGGGSVNDFQDTSAWSLDQDRELWVKFTPKFDGEIRSLKAKNGSVEYTATYASGDVTVVNTYYIIFQLTDASDSKTWPDGSYTFTVKYRKSGDTSDRTVDLTATLGSVFSEGAVNVDSVTESGTTTTLHISASPVAVCLQSIRIYSHTDGHLIGDGSFSIDPTCEYQVITTGTTSVTILANTSVNDSVDVWVDGVRLLTTPEVIDVDFGYFETGLTVAAP